MWLISCFVAISVLQTPSFSKSKNDLAETNTLLNRLIMRTIQSGVIPVAYPNTFLDLPPVYTGGKLYVRQYCFRKLNGRKRQIQTLETSDGSTVGVHSANVEHSDGCVKKHTLRM
ncbi:hypothetical protein B0H14DRAFT_2989887 [Mycena olivaceomarginata]|nr:hypothetical protein B0H14DRAFT_2989887 [Mycena olivaceomarginata]